MEEEEGGGEAQDVSWFIAKQQIPHHGFQALGANQTKYEKNGNVEKWKYSGLWAPFRAFMLKLRAVCWVLEGVLWGGLHRPNIGTPGQEV